MRPLKTLAPAKFNPTLLLGQPLTDGRSELVTVIDSLTLADTVAVAASTQGDAVNCDGVSGENIAFHALTTFRSFAGVEFPPLTVTIEKQIPIAAGMGGGSADAAAVLRICNHLTDDQLSPVQLRQIAAMLGSDIPSQITPGRSIATGAGDVVESLPRPAGYSVVVLPADYGLSTADVYDKARELKLGRPQAELNDLSKRLRALLLEDVVEDGLPPAEFLVNDLAVAAIELSPEIEERLRVAAKLGCDEVMVSGSGPTVVGIFRGDPAGEQALAAVAKLAAELKPGFAAVPADEVPPILSAQ